MKKITSMVVLLTGLTWIAGPAVAADCVIQYARTACKGKEAESFKKCDGKAECAKTVPADNEPACTAAAMKACDNDRIDITKYKVITAKFGDKALAGGFDAKGAAVANGPNFCDAKRPDLNKCE